MSKNRDELGQAPNGLVWLIVGILAIIALVIYIAPHVPLRGESK